MSRPRRETKRERECRALEAQAAQLHDLLQKRVISWQLENPRYAFAAAIGAAVFLLAQALSEAHKAYDEPREMLMDQVQVACAQVANAARQMQGEAP